MDSFILVPILFLWGLIHSGLASLTIKDLINNKLGERAIRYYRLAYNIFAGISFFPIIGLMIVIRDTQLYSIPKPWIAFTLFAQLLSLLILVIGLKQTGALKFLGLTPFLGEKQSESQSFITNGLYKYVRHPLYSAGLVLLWCSPVMTTNSLLVSICLSIYIVVGAIFEERKLEIEYGDLYREYRQQVSMLIPCLKWNK